jgi:hypothetical protein
MATGVRHDINLSQGSRYSCSMTLTDSSGDRIILSGYSGYAPIKPRYGDTGSFGEFEVSITNPASGIFSLVLEEEDVSAIPPTQAAYEVILYPSGGDNPLKYINGYVTVYPAV